MDDRTVFTDAIARLLADCEGEPAHAILDRLRAGGWLWPREEDLLLPRPEHVAVLGIELGRALAPLAWARVVAQQPLPAGGGDEWAVLASCAQVAGCALRLVDDTVAHVRTRRQFGAPIGSQQAVQHRAVDMHVAAQELRALVLATAGAMAAPHGSAAVAAVAAVARARLKCVRSARIVMQGAVQLHGAMGLTQELPVGRAVMAMEAELQRRGGPGWALLRLQDELLQDTGALA